LHLGSDSEAEKYYKIIERAIKEAGKKGITKNHFYNKTRGVGPMIKNKILNEMIESGKVFTSEGEIPKRGFAPVIYYWKK
ncbi:MAG: hypothetical protein PHH73_06075, partial [Candidatus Rickettsiella isopodorum]|nr:hypothetical protein [Candidatus Rickettsiella isopodorum]